MNPVRTLLLALALTLAWPAFADTLLVAGGAGYKRPISEIATAFEKRTGTKLEQIYGHMAGVLAQAKQSGQVAVIFGDLSYLEKAESVAFAGFLPVGEGHLVVAWPKRDKDGAAGGLKRPEDLAEPRFARIALADAKAAIYGAAATEFMRNSGLEATLKDRLRQVATVPQVTAYLVSGEVDAGFINVTEALAVRDKLGGYLEIDGKLHSPIRIVAGIVKGFEAQPQVLTLKDFLASPEARAILGRYGL